MMNQEFFEQLDARIAKYDLLCHPFYKAWTAGELTRDDLREYALDYYHHVAAFPLYLAALAIRLEEGELRRAVLANMCEENGSTDTSGIADRSHAKLWLDFAEGMGATRDVGNQEPLAEIKDLIAFFSQVAGDRTPEEALAAFYVYESQVPRVAAEKARGLYLRVFHATHPRRCLSLPRVASATRKTSGSQSASCGERIGSWRKRRSGTLGGAGRNRGTANGTGSGCLIRRVTTTEELSL